MDFDQRSSDGIVDTILGKRSWWGCGNHVPSVMDSVSESDRCDCEPQVEKEGKKYPPKADKAD